MPWKGKTIKDLRMRTPILYPLKYEKANMIFEITEDELEDLMINLDPKLSRELDTAFEEVKRGRLLSHEEVFREL